jgi:hypothetical protein
MINIIEILTYFVVCESGFWCIARAEFGGTDKPNRFINFVVYQFFFNFSKILSKTIKMNNKMK